MSVSGGPSLRQLADCASDLAAPPMTFEDAGYVAPLLQVLADPVRLRLVSSCPRTWAGRPASATSASAGTSPTTSSRSTSTRWSTPGSFGRVEDGVSVYYRLEPGVLSGLVNLTAALTR